MPDITSAAKRLLLGRPMRSDRADHTLLGKRLALPLFASDALSSVAYAPDQILLTLAISGTAAVTVSPWVGIAVALVMLTVVASYRQNVHAYPSGGGDYEVATVNLGKTAGLTVASSLMVDYVLTVAVSVSSGAEYAASALPFLRGHQVPFAITIIVLLAFLNLRGLKESGRIFAIPVYLFMAAVGLTIAIGTIRHFLGDLPLAESAAFELRPEPGASEGLVGLGGAFLVARAFASGAAALTGVEAISNGVPAFRKPKSKNAATTLALLGGIAVAMILGILFLARAAGVQMAENPHEQLTLNGVPVGTDYVQHPALSQLVGSVFSGIPIVFLAISAVTGLILILAANTAFNGFPILGSILARDGYLPRQLHTRGDRLVLSNGILALALMACALVWFFDASVTRLIQLYIVGVFVSFTLSQFGMVKHWTRALRTVTDQKLRRTMTRSRLINAFGFGMTGLVLVIVLVTKFVHGAWIAILLMALAFLLMKSISRHYERVADEVKLEDDISKERSLPSRVHAIVLVSRLHKPTMRALAYARAARPSALEAVTVAVDTKDSLRLLERWDSLDIPVPLRVLDSPFREITRPVLQYVRTIRRASPRDLIVVYIPEYVVTHWWEQVLHNQSALRLKGRLLFMPGVVVASVPWQIDTKPASPREDRHSGSKPTRSAGKPHTSKNPRK